MTSSLAVTVFCFLHLATNWASGEDDHVVARAEYDFSAASEEEISLRAGDLINLAPKGETSLLGFTVIFPLESHGLLCFLV